MVFEMHQRFVDEKGGMIRERCWPVLPPVGCILQFWSLSEGADHVWNYYQIVKIEKLKDWIEDAAVGYRVDTSKLTVTIVVRILRSGMPDDLIGGAI